MKISQTVDGEWSQPDALLLQTQLEGLRAAVESAEADRLQYLHDKKIYADTSLAIEDQKTEIARLTECIVKLQDACKDAALQHDLAAADTALAVEKYNGIVSDSEDLNDEKNALTEIVEELTVSKTRIESEIEAGKKVLDEQHTEQLANIAEINALSENIVQKLKDLSGARADLENLSDEANRVSQQIVAAKAAADAIVEAAVVAAENTKDLALQEKNAIELEVVHAREKLQSVYEEITAAHESKENALSAKCDAEESLVQVQQAADEVNKEIDERNKQLDQREKDIEQTRHTALIAVAKDAKEKQVKIDEALIASLLK